jgi:hypothetical protein
MRSNPITGTHWRRSASALRMLGVIFRKAQNMIQDPAKLRRLVADLTDPRWLYRRRSPASDAG